MLDWNISKSSEFEENFNIISPCLPSFVTIKAQLTILLRLSLLCFACWLACLLICLLCSITCVLASILACLVYLLCLLGLFASFALVYFGCLLAHLLARSLVCWLACLLFGLLCFLILTSFACLTCEACAVEHQELNHTTPAASFGWVSGFQLDFSFALLSLLASFVWFDCLFCFVCLICLICLALLALLVFASLTYFAWQSFARFDLVAKLVR